MRKIKKGIIGFVALVMSLIMASCVYIPDGTTSFTPPSGYYPGESSSSELPKDSEDSSVDGDSADDNSSDSSGDENLPEGDDSSGADTPPEGGENTGDGDNDDGGEVVIPPAKPSYQLIKPLNDESSSKVLVKTKYTTDSAVVADVVATDYGADPTGQTDSTNAIQNAVNSVENMGGGTVFLPIGEYVVSSLIHIPDYVSLVGDWNPPNADNTDGEFDYGTVILAKPQVLGSAKPQDKALFTIGGGAGLVGLTFYYVNQSITNVKNYGYTVYANAPATATFKNLTFLNSTYGIGVSLNTFSNELVNIENIYGTFIYNAIHHNATTDVGFYNNIHISTKYWQNASTKYKCGNASKLNTVVTSSLTAMILGDLDDQLISNVTIEGGKLGIKFTTGIRSGAGFWGLVHKANINCVQGVYADYLNQVSGVVFTDSNVGMIENNSSVGCIKMSNSTYQSTGTGRVLKEGGNVAKTSVETPLDLEFSDSERLFIANDLTSGGAVDNASALQGILNSVGEEGGIVLVPNGVYRLNSPVVVPNNVELRSSQSIFSRTNDHQTGENGVVFITYTSGNTFVLKENAGLVGVRIWHAKNDFLTAESQLSSGARPSDTSVKGNGAGAYAYRNESVGAYVGFDFTACDNHILKSNYGISYLNFIKAGGKNGVITQCLSNPNFMTRSNLYTYFNSGLSIVANWERIRQSGETNADFALLRDDIGRTFTKMVRLEDAENEVAFNVFAYGEAGLFDMVNSTSTLINTSLDYIPTAKIVYELSGGSCDIISSLRVHGTSLQVNSGKMTAYGRIAFGQTKEAAYDSSVELEDKIEYVSENATWMTLFTCDSWNFDFNVSLNRTAEYIKGGSGSWKWQTTTLEGRFSAFDISAFKNGYLHFYIYCSDITQIGDQGQIEITSSGYCDINEYGWSLFEYVTKTGWNEVWLDLSGAEITGGAADLANINYFRIYTLNGSATFYIDEIAVVTD